MSYGIYFLTFFSGTLFGVYSDILFGMLSGIYSDIFSGILSLVSSQILCAWGPAGITLIQRLLFGSGGEHCDLELAVEVRRGSFDPEVAVQVRRGTLRSRVCSWGPAGITLIQTLLFRPGREHCDLNLGLAVEVRRGSLWSRGCCSGLAGNTAI